jgi:hypothetical protein
MMIKILNRIKYEFLYIVYSLALLPFVLIVSYVSVTIHAFKHVPQTVIDILNKNK